MVPVFQKEVKYLYKHDNSFNWKGGVYRKISILTKAFYFL